MGCQPTNNYEYHHSKKEITLIVKFCKLFAIFYNMPSLSFSRDFVFYGMHDCPVKDYLANDVNMS